MKLRYFLRVLLISFEALAILLGAGAWLTLRPELHVFVHAIHLGSNVVETATAVPLAIFAWIVVEGRSLLQGDKDVFKVLIAWEDYWKLKVHVVVSLLYALVFIFFAVAAWVVPKDGIRASEGFLLLSLSIVGQLIVAASIYFAGIRVQEILESASSAAG